MPAPHSAEWNHIVLGQIYILNAMELPLRSVVAIVGFVVQGRTIITFPGCVKLDEKVVFC